jgi:EREBP-like factor
MAEDVARTYDEAAQTLHGENTLTNFTDHSRHATSKARLSKGLQHVIARVAAADRATACVKVGD